MRQKCKNCVHYVGWPSRVAIGPVDYAATGVCTAPRPRLGKQPEREVRGFDGENCPVFEAPEDEGRA